MKADVDKKILKKNNELLYASSRGNIDKIKSLLKKGINIDCRDSFGITPLMKACNEANAEVVEYLIERGADVNTVDYYGSSPIFYLLKFYIFSNGKVGEKRLNVLKILIKNGADLDHKNNAGYRFIHKVIQINNPDMLKILIEAGCDINFKFDYGTPLRIARKLEKKELAGILEAAGAIDAD